jgi:hypothetical protein
MVLAMLPFGSMAVAAPREDNRHLQAISFTMVTTDVIEEGEARDNGDVFELRGAVIEEAVSGDITGTAIVTQNGNLWEVGECTDDFCPLAIDSWMELRITDENGTWDGQMAFQIDDSIESEFGKVFLIGRGGNSGKAIYGDMTFLYDEDNTTQITGYMTTLVMPQQGVRFLYDGCCLPPAQTAGHVRLATGTSTDSGDWHAEYPLLIPGYATFGESTISTAKGTIESVLMLQNAGSNRVGYFMLLGGTGDYENLYGFGIVRTAAYDSSYCEDGAGAGGHWIGRAFAN